MSKVFPTTGVLPYDIGLYTCAALFAVYVLVDIFTSHLPPKHKGVRRAKLALIVAVGVVAVLTVAATLLYAILPNTI